MTAPLLVADVGGTNTRVALADAGHLLPGTIRRYRNADFSGFDGVLRAYRLNEAVGTVGGACAAVAGPVRNGCADLTNVDWSIDGALLARAAETSVVAVLNDLQAQGHAIGHVAPELLRRVMPGDGAAAGDTKLVIGVGTGFNAAPVYEGEWGRQVPPSECGHSSLPVSTERELRLLRVLETAHGFASIEDLLSGRGLERVYAFLAAEAGAPRVASAAEISVAIGIGDDPCAVAAARLFARMLGTVAGNLALMYLPFGGVFLAGGVARAVAPHLAAFGFVEAFRDKGRFSGFMDAFPVTVIEDDFAALTGCACHLVHLGRRRLAAP